MKERILERIQDNGEKRRRKKSNGNLPVTSHLTEKTFLTDFSPQEHPPYFTLSIFHQDFSRP
jgi:hypothetical protein